MTHPLEGRAPRPSSRVGTPDSPQQAWIDSSNNHGVAALVVQNDVEQRAVHLQTAVVMNETQFPESVHEKTDSRTSRTDHLGQGLLADLGNYRLGFAFLAKMSEQQKDPGQPFFARIEKLIHQIFFVTDVPR